MDELVKAVRDYALKHYEQNGWDYIVECYSNEEIEMMIGKARTIKGAILKVARVSGIYHWAAYRKDVQGA